MINEFICVTVLSILLQSLSFQSHQGKINAGFRSNLPNFGDYALRLRTTGQLSFHSGNNNGKVLRLYGTDEDDDSSPDIDNITLEGKKDVQEVIDAISEKLKKFAPANSNSDKVASGDTGLLKLEINETFDKLMKSVRDSKLSDSDKSFVILETSSIAEDVSKGANPFMPEPKGKINASPSKTSIYSDSVGPVLLVYGPGPVGLKMKEIASLLGKSARIKLLNADNIAIMKDSELNFNVRDVNSAIIAADAVSEPPKGWFGGSGLPERKYCLDAKALKRLLNSVMNDQNRRYSDVPVKFVWYGNAIKQQKSIASFLTGDTADMDSEFVLQCTQRGFRYMSILTGNIIPDDGKFPENVRMRSSYTDILSDSKVHSENSFLITTKRSVEASECTRLSTACEALFRASTHPNGNSTITVLSTKNAQEATDYDWDDEFSKVDGPEIMRIRLDYSTAQQAASRLGRLIPQLALPGSGIVTPIDVTRFQNGIRIIFVPKSSNYESVKDEKQREEMEKKLTNEQVKKSKYIPPEKDADALKPLDENLPRKSKKMKKLEGGVEILIDESPVPRIRIRRCNMGPDTVVKEESEALIVKSIVNTIKVLENDQRILGKN